MKLQPGPEVDKNETSPLWGHYTPLVTVHIGMVGQSTVAAAVIVGFCGSLIPPRDSGFSLFCVSEHKEPGVGRGGGCAEPGPPRNPSDALRAEPGPVGPRLRNTAPRGVRKTLGPGPQAPLLEQLRLSCMTSRQVRCNAEETQPSRVEGPACPQTVLMPQPDGSRP